MESNIVIIRRYIISVIVVGIMFFMIYKSFLNQNWIDTYTQIDNECQLEGVNIRNTVAVIIDTTKEIPNNIPYKNNMINIFGFFLNLTGCKSFYNQEYGINISDNGYIVGYYPYTTGDYEVDQMILLKKYLDDYDVELLYVNEPIKYVDDNFFMEEFGIESFSNRNADIFLKRIGEEGINYLDLRKNMCVENIDSFSLFYKTDHHWNVFASKWGAFCISKELNSNYGFDIDTTIYDDTNFYSEKYISAWLGEQGQKVSEAYVGLEDYVLLTPRFETDYTHNGVEGLSFEMFIDRNNFIDTIDEDGNIELSKYKRWHYTYNSYGSIINNNINEGRILYLGDSYDQSLIPFLSLGVNRIDFYINREFEGENLFETIDIKQYDVVIIGYAQFMIGAHDQINNANYSMFSFFE